jgi:hypothetical protein
VCVLILSVLRRRQSPNGKDRNDAKLVSVRMCLFVRQCHRLISVLSVDHLSDFFLLLADGGFDDRAALVSRLEIAAEHARSNCLCVCALHLTCENVFANVIPV